MAKGSKDIYDEAISWESDTLSLLQISEGRAWMVAKIAIIITIIAIIGAVSIMWMKRSQVFLVRENPETGAPDLITSITDMAVPYDEIRDKYWLSQYVRARERYDWQTVQDDYDMIGLMSNEQVGREYATLFEGDDALDKKFGDHIKVAVDIQSRTVDLKGLATIRFDKTISDTRTQGMTPQKRKWVATITYEYHPVNWEKESKRMINPFGFNVTSYRVDPEAD